MECTGEQKHEPKVCPACKTNFICKMGDVANCQCSLVKLTNDERTYIAEHFNDCLCCFCMKEMKAAYSTALLELKLKVLLRIL
jgi:hypothetical protein